jgi:hypothetical protein
MLRQKKKISLMRRRDEEEEKRECGNLSKLAFCIDIGG